MVRQVVLASLVMGILAFLVYYYLVDQLHYSAFAASNMVLLLMVLLENVHVFNCRSERKSVFQIPLRSNYYLILGVLGAQGIHILAMYTPLLQDVLMVEPVSLLQWASMLLVSITLLVAVELYKLWLRAKERDLKKAAPVEDVATA
jgi:magnesium-transporting ATPase (P-type)